MLFNSYEFIFVFLPITIAGYFFLGKITNNKLANVWLVFASLLFYSYWEISFLPILLCSILFNYTISGIIIKYRKVKEKKSLKKYLFITGISANIALLSYYKYTDFFLTNLNRFIGTDFTLLHLILPLGISFFTITQMVYLVDCYEGVAKDHDFVNYSLFVSFFPHLLSGPILYHKAMMKQFNNDDTKKINWDNLYSGATLFIIGLAKKVLIADTFLIFSHPAFSDPVHASTIDVWVAALSYMLQLYFDFSGYSDMAVGAARMININIPLNFNSPYKAKNIIDFWQRWHMSLTSTITNYLYTPIFMSFKKMTFNQAMISTFLAMFIAGIWHGAGWSFIVFGSMHGIGLVINHVWKHYHLPMNILFGRIITLIWVLLSFVFFRANSAHEAVEMIRKMFNIHYLVLEPDFFITRYIPLLQGWDVKIGTIISYPGWSIKEVSIAIAVGFIVTFALPNSNQIVKNTTPSYAFAAFLILIGIWSVCCFNNITEFLYFQF